MLKPVVSHRKQIPMLPCVSFYMLKEMPSEIIIDEKLTRMKWLLIKERKREIIYKKNHPKKCYQRESREKVKNICVLYNFR